MNAPQFEQLHGQGVLRVARELGLRVLEHGGRVTLAPCPACNAEKREANGRRGPVGVIDGSGWHCHRCGESGDACSLAHHLVNQGGPWAEVFDACAELGLCEPRSEYRPTGRPRRPYVPPPPLPRPAPPERPPLAEVEALWGVRYECPERFELRVRTARPLTTDSAAVRWCRWRGLDPEPVALFDLAWTIPLELELSSWAWRDGRPWNQHRAQYRLIVPLFDAMGRLTSLHARALHLDHQVGQEKSSQPRGYSVAGLVMANRLGQRMLAHDVDACAQVTRKRDGGRPGLVICEGLPDFLSWGTAYSDGDEESPAVIGIFSGSWTQELADRIPKGAHVLDAIHDDSAGEKYSNKLLNSLAERLDAGELTAARWAAMDLE